ncbi:MAG: hypothetical protein AAFV53_27970 [Myxococcota bacterium]
MSLRILPLHPSDVGAVFQLGQRIYADDPMWTPTLQAWEQPRLRAAARDPRRFVLFAAHRDGEVVGTLSARRDRVFDENPDEKPIWFGHFECVSEPDVCRALFDAAIKQAREWGASRIRGPMNLSRFEFVGLTVKGFDIPPPLMQGHHPRYYPRLIEDAGLSKHHDVYAYDTPLVVSDGRPRPIPAAFLEKAQACDIDGLEIRSGRRRTMGRDIEDVFMVLNEAYATVPDISPMSRATFMGLGRMMFTLAGPELIQIATVKGRPVAFGVCIPELNEALIACRGRLLPLGAVRLLRNLPRIHTAAFKLIGVVPDFRGSGVHAAVIAAIVRGAQKAGYDRIDGSVIDERNGPMRGVVEGLGLEIYRVYRFFERTIDR